MTMTHRPSTRRLWLALLLAAALPACSTSPFAPLPVARPASDIVPSRHRFDTYTTGTTLDVSRTVRRRD